LAQNGRCLVEEIYDWKVIAGKADRVLSSMTKVGEEK